MIGLGFLLVDIMIFLFCWLNVKIPNILFMCLNYWHHLCLCTDVYTYRRIIHFFDWRDRYTHHIYVRIYIYLHISFISSYLTPICLDSLFAQYLCEFPLGNQMGWPMIKAFISEHNMLKKPSLCDSCAYLHTYIAHRIYICVHIGTAQGGGGSFKDRKLNILYIYIGEVSCCDAWMAERTRWWIARWLRLWVSLSLYLSVSPSLCVSLSLYLCICLPT